MSGHEDWSDSIRERAQTTIQTHTSPEVIVLTRTIVLDNDDLEQTPRVLVQRHRPDFENLAEAVFQRILATVGQSATGCHYFNPATTVSCTGPTLAFFVVVGKEQARWCRQVRHTFPKRTRRRVQNWVSHERTNHMFDRYLNRAACFTGILFIDQQLVPPHLWPKYQLDKGDPM